MASDEFEVLAAIDLRGGRVVRLRQGDYARETEYGDDPVAVAERFVDGGARWLHVVDLDGARLGEPVQVAAIRRIVAAVAGRSSVEVSGGLRTVDAIETMLGAGADRVAMGTAAVEDPGLVADLVGRLGPDRIAVSVDVREGLAIGRGWRPGSPGVDPEVLLARLAAAGAVTFEVTAIERDGVAGGPDLAGLERLVGLGAGSIIASGGIRDAADLRSVAAVGCRGAIIGRALYDGSLTIEAAVAAVPTGARPGRRPPGGRPPAQ